MMKQMILACLLTVNLVGCEVSSDSNSNSKSSSTTVNGLEVSEAFKPFLSNLQGSCREGNLKVNWVSVETYTYKPKNEQNGVLDFDVILKSDKTATVRVENVEYSYKMINGNFQQVKSVDTIDTYTLNWDYDKGTIALPEIGVLRLINYNGENRIMIQLDENFVRSNYAGVTNLKSYGSFGANLKFDQTKSDIDVATCEQQVEEMGF